MKDSATTFVPKEILIVDDNIDIVQLLSQLLRREGHQTYIAMDGERALEITQDRSPDLIILDLGIPKVPGEEVCRLIRKNKKTRGIPIIMLTGKTGDADKIVGRVIGADRYITKPCKIAELIKAIQDLTRPEA